MAPIEETFEHELNVFKGETENAGAYLYIFLALNEKVATEKDAYELANKTAFLWNSITSSLETSLLVVLGRIFGHESKHNIDSLFRMARDYSGSLFSKEALLARKRKDIPDEKQLRKYISNAYEPSIDDFRCLRKYIKKYRRIYELGYKDIRNLVKAHKILSSRSEIQELYAKTRIIDLERMIAFFVQMHEILQQLYINGRKPRFRRIPYSVKFLMREKMPDHMVGTVQQWAVEDTKKLFDLLLKT